VISLLPDGAAAILRRVPKQRADSARGPVKTTVELPGDLWREAKIRAMDDRVDLRTVLIRALEGYLGVSPKPIAKRGRAAHD
jgi:hypothetical protein